MRPQGRSVSIYTLKNTTTHNRHFVNGFLVIVSKVLAPQKPLYVIDLIEKPTTPGVAGSSPVNRATVLLLLNFFSNLVGRGPK